MSNTYHRPVNSRGKELAAAVTGEYIGPGSRQRHRWPPEPGDEGHEGGVADKSPGARAADPVPPTAPIVAAPPTTVIVGPPTPPAKRSLEELARDDPSLRERIELAKARGPARRGAPTPAEEVAAFHEAGHVVMARHLGVGVHGADIGADGEGTTFHRGDQAKQLHPFDHLCFYAAGAAGEELFTGRASTGADADREKAHAAGLVNGRWGDAIDAAKAVILDHQFRAWRNVGESLIKYGRLQGTAIHHAIAGRD